jgi:Cu(I)/Ag(I) efflux system protein CusF
MKPVVLTAMLSLTALLAACGQKSETNETAAGDATTPAASTMGEATTNTSGDMSNMTMPADGAAKMAKGSGTVIAVDKAAGTITLDHGPIAEANWPAMTMAFKARPELIDSVKVGDKVTFDLALKQGAGEVMAIRKQ